MNIRIMNRPLVVEEKCLNFPKTKQDEVPRPKNDSTSGEKNRQRTAGNAFMRFRLFFEGSMRWRGLFTHSIAAHEAHTLLIEVTFGFICCLRLLYDTSFCAALKRTKNNLLGKTRYNVFSSRSIIDMGAGFFS